MNKKTIFTMAISFTIILFYMSYQHIYKVKLALKQVQQENAFPNFDEKNSKIDEQTSLSIDLNEKVHTSHVKNNTTSLKTETFIGKQKIISKYHDCIIYLRYKIGSPEFKEDIFYSSMNNKARTKINARHQHCYDVSQEHPEYLLNNPYLFEIRSDQTLYTHLEKALDGQESYEYDEIQGKQLIAELNQADASLLFHSRINYFLLLYYDKFTAKEVMKLIRSQDSEYTFIMQTFAQTQYSCNKNAGCDSNSPTMIEVCSGNEVYCDLIDYNAYLNRHLTSGQQADLKIIYHYIENLFENQ